MLDQFGIFDTTALMIIIKYGEDEFMRCSYLVTHEYQSEKNKEEEPDDIVWEDIIRNVKSEEPVINISEIKWN